jgi:hypothetical protein
VYRILTNQTDLWHGLKQLRLVDRDPDPCCTNVLAAFVGYF